MAVQTKPVTSTNRSHLQSMLDMVLTEKPFRPLKWSGEMLQAYGTFLHTRLMMREMYLTTDPDVIEDVLVTHVRHFEKSDIYKDFVARFIGNGILVSDGEFWRKQRRLVQPAFHRQRIDNYAGIMTDLTTDMLDTWQDGDTRDIHHDMVLLTFAIVSKTLFDLDAAKEAPRVANAVEELQDSVNSYYGIDAILPRWIQTPKRKHQQDVIDEIDELMYSIINERRAEAQDRGDLLSMLLTVEDADTGEKMADKQVRDELLTLFMAGHETTANTLSWAWMLLGQNPDKAQKLYDEVDRVLEGRVPTIEDLANMHYLEQVVKEVLRLYPAAWAVARHVLDDVTVGGYPIEKDTIMQIHIYHMQRRADFFDQPNAFMPERWTPEFEKSLPRYAYIPFGAGQRVCIGKPFAEMEAKLLLAQMAQRFKIELDPTHEIVPSALITLYPKTGIRAKVTAR